MPLIRDDAELVRIELPENGEWVEVKPRLSLGERQRVTSATLRMRGTPQKGGVKLSDAEVDLGAATAEAMFCAIKRWSFEEPVTRANILLLDAASADVIAARLEELYESRTDDERKNFGSSGATPLSDEEASQLSSVGSR